MKLDKIFNNIILNIKNEINDLYCVVEVEALDGVLPYFNIANKMDIDEEADAMYAEHIQNIVKENTVDFKIINCKEFKTHILSIKGRYEDIKNTIADMSHFLVDGGNKIVKFKVLERLETDLNDYIN